MADFEFEGLDGVDSPFIDGASYADSGRRTEHTRVRDAQANSSNEESEAEQSEAQDDLSFGQDNATLLSSSVPVSVPSSMLRGEAGSPAGMGAAELESLESTELSRSFQVPSSYSRPVPVSYGIDLKPRSRNRSRKAVLLDRLWKATQAIDETRLEELVASAEAQMAERAQGLAAEEIEARQRRTQD